MYEKQEAFIRSMVDCFPDLAKHEEEHLTDNFGELLPHVFMGDVARYGMSLLHAENREGLQHRRKLADLLAYLEESYAKGDPDVQELISASFLENLPRRNEPDDRIRQMLGPNLRRQMEVIG